MANDPLWIEHAHLKKGAFTRKARAAGKSVAAFSREKHRDSTTQHQANAAKALRGLAKHRS